MSTRPKLIRPAYTLPWRRRPFDDTGMSTAE
jgi:hypothetical protein